MRTAIATTAPTDPVNPQDVQAMVEGERAAALAFVEANKVAVVDLVTLTRAREVRKAIGDKQKTIIAGLAKPKAWAHGLHKWFCSLEAAALVQYEILDGYEAEQIRLFDEADKKRRAAIEAALSEARRREDEARAASAAAAFETDGAPEIAEAILAEQLAAPAPVVVLQDEVRAIQTFKRNWHYRIDNPALVPRDFLAIDEPKLGQYARNMKETARVAGVTFYYTDDPIR